MFNFWTLWVPFGERPCLWVPKRSTNILATTLGITRLLRLRSMLTGAARGKAEGSRCHTERRLPADRPTRRLPERRRLQVDLLVPKADGGRSGESRRHCERHKPSSRTGSQAATHPKMGMLPHTSDSGSVRKMMKGQPRGTVLGHLGIWRANSDRIPLMQIMAVKEDGRARFTRISSIPQVGSGVVPEQAHSTMTSYRRASKPRLPRPEPKLYPRHQTSPGEQIG